MNDYLLTGSTRRVVPMSFESCRFFGVQHLLYLILGSDISVSSTTGVGTVDRVLE